MIGDLVAHSHIHLIGIAGSGLSAIARVLLDSGFQISGSDRQATQLTRSLEAAGAQVYVGHRAENIRGADLVIRSSAIPDDNPEAIAARAAGIPLLKRSDFLGKLMAGRQGIAVAGTHGKTTTTAMIAWILAELGQDPSFIVGGTVKALGTNARAGNGPAFVIEADEYDGMFLGLRPKIAVVTNVEHDHPDCYPTSADYERAFQNFAGRLEPGGVLLGCGDDPGAARLIRNTPGLGTRVLSYGANSGENFYRASDRMIDPAGITSFEFSAGSRTISVKLSVPGQHNMLNATAALAVAHQLDLPLVEAARALSGFTGVGRRFDIAGEAGGVTVIDDYAHHPSEIRATLAAARSRYPGRALWVVWQPHTYSRTQALLSEFAAAFREADHVLVTEIYASRETPPESGFSGRIMAEAMSHMDVHFSPDLAGATSTLLERLQPGDVLLVLSAGDADQISAQVVIDLNKRNY